MRRKRLHRLSLAWHTTRFFLRRLFEYAATVWLLGLAPFLAHLAAAPPHRGYAWIPNDLYLFVMVVGGNVAIDAFKDRDSDGPFRPLAAILGVGLAVFGAWAFGVLEAGTTPVASALRWMTYRAVVFALALDFFYRVRMLIDGAVIEARRKETER